MHNFEYIYFSHHGTILTHADFSETVHFSKCRAIVCHSEDDTIMEEENASSTNTNKNYAGQIGNSLGLRKEDIYKSTSSSIGNNQKVATILRSRSCRDREILCKYQLSKNSIL